MPKPGFREQNIFGPFRNLNTHSQIFLDPPLQQGCLQAYDGALRLLVWVVLPWPAKP
jgi:hypothetical protein